MPNANIEKAISQGSKKDLNLEEILLEAIGPEKSSFLIEALTDNKNRTIADLRKIGNDFGIKFVPADTVKWQFRRVGTISLNIGTMPVNSEETELLLIECGAENIDFQKENVVLYTKSEDLDKTRRALASHGFTVESFELEYIPVDKIKIQDEKIKRL